MQTGKLNRYWGLVIILLVAIIAVSGSIAWTKYRPSQPVEILLPKTPAPHGWVYIDGAVTDPGQYPMTGDDSIAALIGAAGGTTSGADLNGVRFHIPRNGEDAAAQKVDINRAEAWLLMALPGVGETRAKAIVQYRREHGPFRGIEELTRVEGIGPATYQQMKDLVTVSDRDGGG